MPVATHARELPVGSWWFASVLALVVFLGWREFEFLTDDAFITFRYVSNSVQGRGLVWNPPPFAPVEGYTSFAWAVLLHLCWSVTGVEPPAAANWLGLGFGCLTLLAGWRLLQRLPLPEAIARHRRPLSALVLLATATSPVFLTWLSSGLETAMFVFFVTAWVALATTAPAQRGPAWLPLLSLASAMTALTRPDGLLTVPATVVLLGHHTLRPGSVASDGSRARRVLGLAPLLLVPAHVLWRRWFYGEWLPNTYYAKHVGAWPEAGALYLASFVVENGAWFWLLLLVCWLLATAAGRRGWPAFSTVVVIVTLLAHFSYYTFVIGGDHFEYRVYSHLILLLYASGLWLAAQLFPRAPRWVATTVLAQVLASHPIAWLQHLNPGPLAPHFPPALQPPVAVFDRWQRWLSDHMVCCRRAAHDGFIHYRARFLPTREAGAKISWDERPVLVASAVGMVSWVLPNVAVIDALGLNDWTVARAPVELGQARRQTWQNMLGGMFATFDHDADGRVDRAEVCRRIVATNPEIGLAANDLDHLAAATIARMDRDGDGTLVRDEVDDPDRVVEGRMMAHDRLPPPGYLEGFRANVEVVGAGRVVVEPRAAPLTDAEIVAHEARFRRR